jgi:cytochrome c oxidase subunit IV
MSGEAVHGEASGRVDGHDGGHEEVHEAHGSVALYVWIGVILAIVTGVEVGIFYIEALDAVEAPLLILLSTAKVVLVILFFMHLKMDHRALTWIFMAGVVLATFMVTALVILYHLLPRFGGG